VMLKKVKDAMTKLHEEKDKHKNKKKTEDQKQMLIKINWKLK